MTAKQHVESRFYRFLTRPRKRFAYHSTEFAPSCCTAVGTPSIRGADAPPFSAKMTSVATSTRAASHIPLAIKAVRTCSPPSTKSEVMPELYSRVNNSLTEASRHTSTGSIVHDKSFWFRCPERSQTSGLGLRPSHRRTSRRGWSESIVPLPTRIASCSAR